MLSKFLVSLFVALSFNAFSAETAQAHCEECPVPMRIWVGQWRNFDARLGLEIGRIPGSYNRVSIVVHDLDTGKILASGSGAVPTAGMKLFTARLWSADGRRLTTQFRFDSFTEKVTLRFAGARSESLAGRDLPGKITFE